MASIEVDKDRCKGCELCVSACPQQILGMSEAINTKGYYFAQMNDAGRCIGCTICAIMCPDVAIVVYGNAVEYRLFEYRQTTGIRRGRP